MTLLTRSNRPEAMNPTQTKTLIGTAALGMAMLWLYRAERRAPLRTAPHEPDRHRVPRNLALAASVGAVVALLERPLNKPLSKAVERRRIGLLPMLNLGRKTETAAGLLLMDYSLYWWHILLHRVPFLWRSHIVHHADLHLDSTTALRFHAWEFAASVPWRAAQVTLFGIRPATLRLWQRLTLLEVVFHHSNLRLPIPVERWLSRLIITPRLHGIHHSVVPAETHSNFSSGLTVWDIIHGTIKTGVPQASIEIGVPDYRDARQLRLKNLLVIPFRRG